MQGETDAITEMSQRQVKIGGALGFWGEAHHATAQMLAVPDVDVLIYDFLAEITLSILARARAKDPDTGYAPDFVSAAMAPNLAQIEARGIKVLSNAGGMNPAACAAALRAEIARQGLRLRVAVVEGDDLTGDIAQVGQARDMFTGAPFPAPDAVLSSNAYLGAGPMVAALEAGADIVITGRCVDSAMALAACVHALGWDTSNYDLMAAGALAGHLIECGPQSTGGNFTDWDHVPDLAHIGYPIATVSEDGCITISKPPGTGGLVTCASVAEQMLYEIGDPADYALPDVICDFSQVTFAQVAPDLVQVAQARGRAPSGQLKVSTTYHDGYRAGQVLNFVGRNATAKGHAYVDAVLRRARAQLQTMGLADYSEVHVECFGGLSAETGVEEVAVTAAVKHPEARAVELFLKELVGGALATPPGLHFFTGAGRPKASPVVRLFSSLVGADLPQVGVTCDEVSVPCTPWPRGSQTQAPSVPPPPVPEAREVIDVLLETVAFARSGDKGDSANIGILARTPAFMPWIWAALTPAHVAELFGASVQGNIKRYYLPGTHAMNIVMEQALGGGGIASLRNDSQGKAFAQRLLACKIAVPKDLVLPADQEAP